MSITGEPSGPDEGTLMSHHALFSLRHDEMRVELDKKSLFALASDTRLEILRTLQPMRRTVTQLSDTLDIDKAAIHRHLKKMEEGGLVKRFEDHGFVYYGLSWKARDLLSPNENTKIVIMLSLTWMLCIAVVFVVILGMTEAGHDVLAPSKGPGESYGPSGDVKSRYLLDSSQVTFIALIPSAVLLISAAILGRKGYRGLRRPLQKNPVDGPGSSRPDPELANDTE